MALRQWMVTHEWMVKPTAQTEWIERRGVLVWIAEVFTSLGAGFYLVSLFFGNWWGMAAGWVIIMFLKIPLHLIYFGKPLQVLADGNTLHPHLEDILVHAGYQF